MRPAERLGLVDAADPALSIVAQCRLLKVARSTLYDRPAPVSVDDLAVMRRMDELHLAYPFYGSRRMAAALRREGWSVNRKRASLAAPAMPIWIVRRRTGSSGRNPCRRRLPR
jgi:putative transposase